MNKCVVKESAEKGLNGLHVFFNILEEGVERGCAECEEQGVGIHRQFEVVKAKRGVVFLKLTKALTESLNVYLQKTFRHGEVLCFNCFEEYVEEHTTGFVPAD